MSLKHIKKYYNDLRNQKEEMDNLLQTFSEQADKEVVDSKIVDNLKTMSECVTASFDTIKYIMYLFNLPNNPKKMKKHLDSTKKERDKLNSKCSPEAIKAENESAINSVKSQI